ncbi:V-type ATP synthase subunit F [Arthrobacter bambusae]|jgi:vacuolar-type H+-ATPase subunit F/Vma7|uniref:V-type ATP synthase subunit F n=1 Tax=Arthrobacter TaxID=1663 RepID=UPI001F511498|nr:MULTISPECIES: V-type ATP synthase subunit F [Arthrobacter]MCI0141696.1 V-type ATP synthase subunit F [Arthrobacter bambusae]UYY83191.1 V-type ATP synthase subunit F [Arthrobacter sp. YA7-1]
MFQSIAAIGEQALLNGFRLAGVSVLACSNDAEILRAWRALPTNTAIVILTPASAHALGPLLAHPRSPMTVVLP